MALEKNIGRNPMGKSTKVIGSKVKCMVEENLYFAMARFTSGSSEMAFQMARALENGKMATFMRATM